MEFLKPILRYWSLTWAVFVFWAFAILVAALDVVSTAREAAKKKRAEQKPQPKLDPNPLTAVSVAETVMRGPGQKLDAKREWVLRMATDIVKKVNPTPPVQTLVLEDSKGHPIVHFSNGTRLESYRVDRTMLESAMKGEVTKIIELADMLTRHLTADFLGREDVRPPRTTELARDAKPAAPTPAAAAPTRPAAAPAPAAAAAPAKDPESMSREERLALAKAKAEAMRAAAQGGAKPAAPAAAAPTVGTPAPAAGAPAPAAPEAAAPAEAQAPAAPSQAPAPAAKPADTMTREEKLAAARAKLEEMKKRAGKTD
jgi:hypothetical protein